MRWRGPVQRRMSPASEARAPEAQLKQNQLMQQQCFLEKGVMLEPFVHQVGGHSCVLRFGEQTICKPLIPREHQFYKSLPAAMRKFTPQYRGVVSVSFEEDEEGNLCLIAYPMHSDHALDDQEHQDSAANGDARSKMWKWGNALTSPLPVEADSRSRHSHKDKSVHKSSEDVERLQQAEVLSVEYSHSSKHNPWSLQCHQQHLQRMKENYKHLNQYKFILLENLTWQHTVPCVLDLKMGTRQHGDDASEEKKAMHMRKCEQSTSASIGVRLCGMQVYQSDTGQLMFMNKYLGRKLTLPGFKEALFQFFHSGHRLRHELLSPVLRRLQDMQAALESCESYRFYSSSLLIIYDGAPHRKHARRRAEAELSEEEEEEEEEDEEPEMEEEDEDDVREVSGAFGFPHSPSSEGSSSCSSSSSGSSSSSSSGGSSSGLSQSDSPAVDVRMIDFAHTTCRDYEEDSVIHEGRDSGYIFGLQNLINIISELENHNTD